MGTIRDLFAAAFRRYVIDGSPSSGVHWPEKAEIIELGDAIEGAIMGEVGTSTTSLAIGTTEKVFTTQTSLNFNAGDWILATSDSAPATKWMHGQITSYVPETGVLTFTPETAEGDTTHADWTLRISGPRGDTGVAGASGTSRAVTVRVAATSNVGISSQLENGDSVDGVTLITGDLVLLTGQSTASQNGIYVVPASGAASRHSDFNTYAAHAGAIVVVSEGAGAGTGRAGTVWLCVSPRTGTLGSSDISFLHFGSPETKVLPHSPIIQDGDVILIPAMRYYDRRGTASLAQPADGSAYWEAALATSVSTRSRYFFDLVKAAAEENPIVVASGSDLPMYDSWLRVELGHCINRTFSSKWGLSVLGGRNRAGIVENQFHEGNDPDHAPQLATDCEVVDVVDATLNGLGIYRGVTGSTVFAAYGLTCERTNGGEGVGCRIYVLADSDEASFDFQRTGLWAFQYGASAEGPTAALEKIHSARVRSYIVFDQISAADINRWNIGIQKKVDDTASYIVCGAQFAIRRDGLVSWILRGDYDRVGVGRTRSRMPAPLMSRDLFLLDGRPVTFYPESIVSLREKRDFFASLSFLQDDDEALANSISGKRALPLDPSRIPMGTSSAALRTYTDDIPNDYCFELPITVHKVAGSALGKTPKVLVIGDSIPNLRTLQIASARLASPIGVTVDWVGSIRTSNVEGDPEASGGPYAECRRGRGLGGLVNCTSGATASTPLAIEDEATYLGGGKNTRISYNPFLRPKAGDGSEDAIAQNGWVFDFGNYLTRLASLSTVEMPEIVLITLFTNDWNNDSVATIEGNFAFAIPRILDSIFEAKPDMKVGFSVPGFAQASYTQDRQQRWAPALAAVIAAVNSYEVSDPDGLAVVVPTWAHMSPYDGWELDGTVDPATGYSWAQIGPISDDAGPFHPLGDARLQCAESWAAFIANVG